MLGFGMAVTAPEILRAPAPAGAQTIYIVSCEVLVDGSVLRSNVRYCYFPGGTTAILTVRWVRTSDSFVLGTRTTASGNPVTTSPLAIADGTTFEVQYSIDTSSPGWVDYAPWGSLGVYTMNSGSVDVFPLNPGP